MDETRNKLSLRRLGIDTQDEFTVYMRQDCHICLSEGFEVLTRVVVKFGKEKLIATLNVIRGELLRHGEGALSERAVKKLGIGEGQQFEVSHLPPVESLRHVRSKMYGNRLSKGAIREIIHDISAGNYSSVHLSAFVAATAGDRLNLDEIVSLTQAMIEAGERMQWNVPVVADKHCVGGLPGNRTTPIVVAICASAGLTIPKTSSRAITSPAGTADVMEVLAPVDLSVDRIAETVAKEGGCIAWGGAVRLSPADDILIRVEKALDVDSEGQMIASVLSKKAAAGSTHVVIDIPVGPTAKVRTEAEAEKLKYYFSVVGKAVGLQTKILITDGRQPVGCGIGPAMEARDVLWVLRNEDSAPQDLRERALRIAGSLLELAGGSVVGEGRTKAEEILSSGQAWKKFHAICIAQGGFAEPVFARFSHDITAAAPGRIAGIDNRRLARVAKLAGAPADKSAGLEFFAPLGKIVDSGQTLFRLHAESRGELQYALEYVQANPDIIKIES